MANGVAETRGRIRSRSRTAWVVAALASIVAVDQLTKAWAVSALADGPKHVIGDFLVFDLSRNGGSAFSRFQGYTPVLAVLAIVIALFVARAVRQATDRWTLVGFGARARRRARQPGRPARALARLPAGPRRRLRGRRLVAGLQRRRFVHHDRRDRVDRPHAVRAQLLRRDRDRGAHHRAGGARRRSGRPGALVPDRLAARRGAGVDRRRRGDGRRPGRREESSSARGKRARGARRAAARVRRAARARSRRGRSTCGSPTTTSWSSPSPPVSSCIRVPGTRGERSSTACSRGSPASRPSATRCGRASSTGSTATRAACSSSRDRRARTTRSSRNSRRARSSACTPRWCGAACRRRAG